MTKTIVASLRNSYYEDIACRHDRSHPAEVRQIWVLKLM